MILLDKRLFLARNGKDLRAGHTGAWLRYFKEVNP
jgi:hypothetical protein